MLVAAFALASLLTLSGQPASGRPAANHTHLEARADRKASKRARQRSAEILESQIGPVGDLYASRAKRRIASYLRMRLLELRLRGLERASEVIEHRLPLDALLHDGY